MLPVLTLWGEQFSPRRVEEATGLMLSQKDEVGEIPKRGGRYAGQLLPFGAAVLEVPPDIEPDCRLLWLLQAAERHLPTLRQSGATRCMFHLDVRYWDQCNMEFSHEELARISALGIPLTITCWEQTE